MIQKVAGIMFFAFGTAVVFSARWIVSRFNLDKRMTCDYENELNENEIKTYKYSRAVINVKMAGMLFALPGLVLILVSF